MNSAALRHCCRVLLLLLVCAASCERPDAPGTHAPPSAAARPHADGAHERGHLLAVVTPGNGTAARIRAIVRAAPGELHVESFEEVARLPAGRTLTLLSRGRPAGGLVVGDADAACGAGTATVRGASPLRGPALATDLPVRAGPPLRGALTGSGRREMYALLRTALSDMNQGRRMDISVRMDTVPMPGGLTAFVGSARVRGARGPVETEAAFIIAERGDGGRLEPNLTTSLLPFEAGFPVLLDVVDVDGDGAPEIVAAGSGPRPAYEIIHRGSQYWEGLASLDRCP